MEKIVFIPIPLQDLQTLITDCVSSCLQNHHGHPVEQQPDPNEIGGIALACEITGLAKATVYSLACRRGIPFMKRGKRLYFKRSELQSWIEEGKRYTHKEEAANLGATKKGKGRK